MLRCEATSTLLPRGLGRTPLPLSCSTTDPRPSRCGKHCGRNRRSSPHAFIPRPEAFSLNICANRLSGRVLSLGENGRRPAHLTQPCGGWNGTETLQEPFTSNRTSAIYEKDGIVSVVLLADCSSRPSFSALSSDRC